MSRPLGFRARPGTRKVRCPNELSMRSSEATAGDELASDIKKDSQSTLEVRPREEDIVPVLATVLTCEAQRAKPTADARASVRAGSYLWRALHTQQRKGEGSQGCCHREADCRVLAAHGAPCPVTSCQSDGRMPCCWVGLLGRAVPPDSVCRQSSRDAVPSACSSSLSTIHTGDLT